AAARPPPGRRGLRLPPAPDRARSSPAAARRYRPGRGAAGRRARDRRGAFLPAPANAPGPRPRARRRESRGRPDTRGRKERRRRPRPGEGPRRRSTVVGAQPSPLVMALETELDEAREQVVVIEAGGAPELGEHADRREAGDGVDLVHVLLSRLAVHQEIDARVAARVHGLEHAYAELPGLARLRGAEGRGDAQLRAALGRVLRVVVVELAVGNDLAHHRRLRLLVAEDPELD